MPSHWSSVICELPTLANCSAWMAATSARPGTEATSSSALSRPPRRLLMVPPVATSRTRGNARAAAVVGGAAGDGLDWRGGRLCARRRPGDAHEAQQEGNRKLTHAPRWGG